MMKGGREEVDGNWRRNVWKKSRPPKQVCVTDEWSWNGKTNSSVERFYFEGKSMDQVLWLWKMFLTIAWDSHKEKVGKKVHFRIKLNQINLPPLSLSKWRNDDANFARTMGNVRIVLHWRPGWYCAQTHATKRACKKREKNVKTLESILHLRLTSRCVERCHLVITFREAPGSGRIL